MRRFLPPNLARQTIETPPFWDYLIETVTAECASVLQALGCPARTNLGLRKAGKPPVRS